jgi:hypothetical protein
MVVESAPPALAEDLDSDGDGISDLDEGLADSDQDRVPDIWMRYLSRTG